MSTGRNNRRWIKNSLSAVLPALCLKVMLASRSPVEKIGFESVLSICSVIKLDLLITDWQVTEEMKKTFEEMGVPVKTVKEK